ncbi:hypothetical protein GF342_03400 [Candidatus Woesearchaeota archaeon]|nr:hypothetical protein [Candidatus Woesearchaeota archaeon]
MRYYQEILETINRHKKELPYSYLTLEHELRHIIIEEQEHISELRTLLSMTLKDVKKSTSKRNINTKKSSCLRCRQSNSDTQVVREDPKRKSRYYNTDPYSDIDSLSLTIL